MRGADTEEGEDPIPKYTWCFTAPEHGECQFNNSATTAWSQL